jgi:hypothetical protein
MDPRFRGGDDLFEWGKTYAAPSFSTPRLI